uniref:Replication enhancer n=1 Tax=Ascaris lumbricoides TaxID=6252 RepID=A0A0M3HRF7_ASCLU
MVQRNYILKKFRCKFGDETHQHAFTYSLISPDSHFMLFRTIRYQQLRSGKVEHTIDVVSGSLINRWIATVSQRLNHLLGILTDAGLYVEHVIDKTMWLTTVDISSQSGTYFKKHNTEAVHI